MNADRAEPGRTSTGDEVSTGDGESAAAAGLPLAGVRVLDLSRVLAGPFCTQILADLGADVVKLERPGTGDDTRHWGPPFAGDSARGMSAYFLSCNRGKRSVTLNLAHPAAAAVLDDLLRTADVMIENFLPGAAAKLGLVPECLQKLNPRLITCSISGFGRTGPQADVPGYDLAIQACAGLMSITGEPDGTPMKVGVAVSDVLTGLYAATSVLAGLIGRLRGRTASGFDLALFDCTLASLVNVAQSALVTGRRPQRYGNAHPQIVPYEVFATADGHLALAVGADRQWERFCRAAGRDDWIADSRFHTNPDRVSHRDELIALLHPLLATRSTTEWERLLTAAEVPHARIAYVDEILTSPQTTARKMTCEVRDAAGRPTLLVGNPIHWRGRPEFAPTAAPELGAHTDEVLEQWLHYDVERRKRLRSDGVFS